jgi:hypothetical protein
MSDSTVKIDWPVLENWGGTGFLKNAIFAIATWAWHRGTENDLDKKAIAQHWKWKLRGHRLYS